MRKLIPLLLAVLVFASCQHPVSVSLSSPSPDGKTVISVDAKKKYSLDPLTVVMEVRIDGKSEGSMQFEVTGATLDSSNLKFVWADSNNCLITFTHTDGEKRVFQYYANASDIILREVKKD